MIITWKTKNNKNITKEECKSITAFIKSKIKETKDIEFVEFERITNTREQIKGYSVCFIHKFSASWNEKFCFLSEHSYDPRKRVFDKISNIGLPKNFISYTGELEEGIAYTYEKTYNDFIMDILEGMQKITNNKFEVTSLY